MGKIVAVTNQKGGVGKTTTTVNLASALTARGLRVLLADMDPQANATTGMGVDKNAEFGIYDVLCGAPAQDAVRKTEFGDILPANRALSGATVELVSAPEREFVLKKALSSVKNKYDYILIDCPPSLELLTVNSLCAADSVLIPVQCEFFALEGLADLITSIRRVKQSLNRDVEIEGVLLTMYDTRTVFSREVAREIKKYFPGKVYGVTIPRSVRIAEAPSYGAPVVNYDPSSRGAQAYRELADEFLKRK
ncbi:MAG: ParA family protein [Oscillospiraceae bacterium]|nr:ParA family protein [Oscillospiraceae bacterium]